MREVLEKIKALSKEYSTGEEYKGNDAEIIFIAFSHVLDAIAKEMEEKIIIKEKNYSACSEEIFNTFLYNHVPTLKEDIEKILKKHI